jgi:hypothetical protein
MFLGGARTWGWLTVVAACAAAGCDDGGGARSPVRLYPVVGCETIDPAPCDLLNTSCQTRLLALAACMRGSAAGELPPVRRMTEAEYTQFLIERLGTTPPPPSLAHFETALSILGLVVPGAFAPATMVPMLVSWVRGLYLSDSNEIVIIDRGQPADDLDSNGVLLHELVHVLQDRDHDLPTWSRARADTYDAVLAAEAVIEGEARFHQQRFGASLLGLDPTTLDWERHFDSGAALAAEWVREQPSPFVASYSSFPYAFGARLIYPRFAARGPSVIADLFAAPPSETLAFLDHRNDMRPPETPVLIAPTPTPDWTLSTETALGAWGIYLLLARNTPIDDALAQAVRWRGDRLWVFGATTAPETRTAALWRIGFADSATAAGVATRLGTGVLPAFRIRISGSEVALALTNAGTPVEWLFDPPPAATAALEHEPAARASASVTAWLRRVLHR